MPNLSKWTSLMAFVTILLFAGAADGLMDTLGLFWFFAIGSEVLAFSGFCVFIGRLLEE